MSRLLLCALLAASACHVDLNDPGTEPLADQVYFPSGIILDPGNRYLYVSNGNSDLRYGGGTVEMIDLERFVCAQQAFLGNPLPAACIPELADADKEACRTDWLDPNIVDCDENHFVARDSTIKVGNFAGNMVMRDLTDRTDPDPTKWVEKRRLFIGVRGDPSVTWMDAYPDEPLANGRRLDCFDANNIPGLTTSPAGCTQAHRIQDYNCHDQPNCLQGTDSNFPGRQLIPTEPFGMALDTGNKADGTPYARLLLSSLETGQVSIIDTDKVNTPDAALVYISNPFFMEDAQHRHGAFALAPQQPHAGANALWYMTSSLTPTIATFRVADLDVLVPSLTFDIRGAFSGGGDVRAVAFQPDGQRMFLTENNPPSVVVVDTRPQPGPAQPFQNANTIVDIIDVCQTPSHLVPHTIEWQGPPGTPPQKRTRLYVVCFQSNQVMVVDPDRPGVDDTILVGRGPNEIIFATDPLLGLHRGYVTNFSEHTIGVIDLEPGSPTENRMIARIGIPVPPMNF